MRYDKYKDSGIEWIGKIPEHWKVKKLKYLGNIVLGKMLTSSDKGNYHKRKYLRAANIVWLKVNIEDVKEMWFSDDELISLRLKKNDLLVSEGGEVGRTCIWNNELKECYIQNSVHKITFNNSTNPFYYLYQFFLYGQRGAFDAIVNRISIAHLTSEKIRNIDFPVPPPEEQTAIANYLDRKTVQIDELIADKKRLLELYEEEKTAIINELVTGKKIWDGNAWTEPAEVKDSGIEWLGEIPEHWDTVSLKWVSKIYSGGTPSKNKTEYWENGTIPWLNSGSVNQGDITAPSEYITEEALNNSSAKWIPKKALVIALAGQGKTKGMVAQVQFRTTCNQSLGVIVPNNQIENRFLMYWLRKNYQNIRNLGGGDKRDGINLEMIGSIPLPLPSKEEQQQIVDYIEKELTRINAKAEKTKKLIKLLKEYKQALISEVVTGKVKVV